VNVGIVGCGLVGRKRAAALGPHRLVAVADLDPARAHDLAARHEGAAVVQHWQDLVRRDGVDVVVVAATHDALAPVSIAAASAGKHVLVEKPAARTPDELRAVIDAARTAGVTVKVGFNHRYHPALQRAHALVATGALGRLLYVRGRYGHGGRPGYEREWRADPTVSGGGELLDQGMHLIDLSRWFLGDFVGVSGRLATYFWKMPVEDNAFLMLTTTAGQVAWLHVSWTEWKNLFSLEIFGEQGKLQIDGLGGSYGIERLTWYQMSPAMGPPATTTEEFAGADRSWAAEFAAFVSDIERGRPVDGSLDDARAALEIVATMYRERDA
jgi:predicted dehydrogenase